MKDDTIQMIDKTEITSIPPLLYPEDHPVMNQSFMHLYKTALSFSNLHLKNQLNFRNVLIEKNQYVHQLYTIGRKELPHLVALHGYGGSSLTYVRMFQYLNSQFQVHALDLFGIGLSSRGKWRDDFTREETETYFVEAIEKWRKTMGIESFILVGHSFGGFISCLYFRKYHQYVSQLIFLSPVGTALLTQQ